ncbi:C-factor [Panus rudis PR-1116 ss-1]|nr:C-factor [Panus rudis PR-1116 ss-1]
MDETRTWLITGSSRGLGLEFVRQLTSSPYNIVIATCRNPEKADSLRSLRPIPESTLHIVQLDISDASSIQAAKDKVSEILGDKGLDYLINNAAINNGNDTPFNFSVQGFRDTFYTNVVGTSMVAATLSPLIEKSNRKVIINMNSGLGSIGLDAGPANMTYSASKAALNMVTYKQTVSRRDFVCLSVDPGWCKTDMGGKDADLEPSESVAGILKLATTVTTENSGKFYRYDGEELPW